VRTHAAGSPLDPEVALQAYLKELRGAHLSISLQRRAQLVLPRLFSHLRAERVRDLRQVTRAHLAGYARSLRAYTTKRGQPLTHGSRVAFLCAIKRFFAHLARRSVLFADPARELPLPREQRLPRSVLSEAEARRLMAEPSPWSITGKRDRALLEVLYGTGIRIGECRRLELTDYDPARMTLLIRDGKGRKDRVVPVPVRAALALDLYLSEARGELVKRHRETAIFLSKYGRPVSKSLLEVIVQRYAQAAGIQAAVSPHTLRHTCATHLLQGGADVRHVQELLGHKRINTTALYTRVALSDLREVIRCAHPREVRRRRRR
jgi:integrase/recombinase XerD